MSAGPSTFGNTIPSGPPRTTEARSDSADSVDSGLIRTQSWLSRAVRSERASR